MFVLAELKKCKVAMWGFGVEGKATAEYLTKNKVPFRVLCRVDEVDKRYDCFTKEVNCGVLSGFDVVIKSPGISPYGPLVKGADTRFTSPTALWFANEYPHRRQAKIIAVTGTKGKSTTVSLLAHVFRNLGLRVNLVGNIGEPLIASSVDYDVIVLEVSSFQIYDGNIHADIAVVTNLFEEHLDWHEGKDNYFRDKLKIVDHSAIKVVNADSQSINQRLVAGDDVRYFNHRGGFYVDHDCVMHDKQALVHINDSALMGQHNLQNMTAVLQVCELMTMNIKGCVSAIKSFKPLAHRLQDLGQIGHHYAINDSIATTPVATLAALQTVDLSVTTLLVGGYDRGNDWCDFARALAENPPQLVLLNGQNAQVIFDHLQALNTGFSYELCDDLADAIVRAQLKTVQNGVILLSPGAPSFDQFDSYIKRGEFFEQQLRCYE